jgi:hypothetical protein
LSADETVPTPTAAGFSCRDVGRMLERRAETKARVKNGNGFGLTLQQWVRVYPTPTAMGHHTRGRMNEWGGSGSRAMLTRMVAAGLISPEDISGQLNPVWVEWLMGFPPGWTDCED